MTQDFGMGPGGMGGGMPPGGVSRFAPPPAMGAGIGAPPPGMGAGMGPQGDPQALQTLALLIGMAIIKSMGEIMQLMQGPGGIGGGGAAPGAMPPGGPPPYMR